MAKTTPEINNSAPEELGYTPDTVSDDPGFNDAGQPATGFDVEPTEAPVEEPKAPEVELDPRERIAAAAREKRLAEMDGAFGEGSDIRNAGGRWAQQLEETGEDDASPEDGSADVNQDDQAAAQQAQQQTPSAQQFIEVKVDGQVVRLTQAELIEHAQKNIAAGNRFETARELAKDLAVARSQQAEYQRQPQYQPQQTSEEPEAVEENQLTDEEILDLIETFQTGDPKEAREAFRRLNAINQRPETNVQDLVARQVQATLAEREAKAQQQQFLNEWSGQNRDVIDDPYLQKLVVSEVTESLAHDLIAIGCDPQQVNQLKANPEQLGVTHRHWRANGYGNQMRDPKHLMDMAAGTVRQHFNIRQEPPQSVQTQAPSRQDRKQGLAPQPRSASVAPSPNLQQARSVRPPDPGQKSRIVEQMRKERGQL